MNEQKLNAMILINDGYGKYESTNPSLNLPQPSSQFIQKYIEEYNKGNIITEVMVEYWDYTKQDLQLKVNLNGNIITIKKIKNSWNKEEVSQILRNFRTDILPFGQVNDFTLNEWIEKNL